MKNRRLIQVFEIYPTAEFREKYSKKVIKKVPIRSKTYDLGQKINIWCHKNALLSSFLNMVGYIYASKRLVYPQYNFTKKELNPIKPPNKLIPNQVNLILLIGMY